MKSIIFSIIFIFTSSYGFEAQDYVIHKTNYEFKNGWYWGEEFIEDNKTKEKKKIQYKISPDRKRELNVLDKINDNLEKQNAILLKIVDILDYSFPKRFPKYTTNSKTGKKCITNSSADCFVMPLTSEAQQLPILGDVVRKPNSKNAKKWLKWYSKYMNQASNLGYALNFTEKQFGSAAYPAMTNNGVRTSNNQEYDVKKTFIKDTILELNDRLEYFIFYGHSKHYEDILHEVGLLTVQSKGLQNIDNFTIVFKDSKYKSNLETRFKNMSSHREQEIYRKTKKIVSQNLFKKYGISQTPMVVMIFKNKKGKPMFWQKLAFANSPRKIFSKSYSFLKYNNIIKSENLTSDNLANSYNPFFNPTTGEMTTQNVNQKFNINEDKDFDLKISEEQKIKKD